MTPGEWIALIFGGGATLAAVGSWVWWLSKMNSGVSQLKGDVTTIATQTTKIGDSMTDFRIKISDHDRRISAIENYEE